MSGMNNELVELNDALFKKYGTLSSALDNSIFSTLNDLSNEDTKELLAEIDSNMMLNRLFTSSFCRKEYELCFIIKEILDERQLVPIN